MMRMQGMALTVVLLAVLGARGEEKKPPLEVEVVSDVAYQDGDTADPERHKLDLYLPRGVKDYPVFFFIHGGGWTRGHKNGFIEHGKAFASQGVGFVATNYRLSPKVQHPAHVEDVARAFAWVVANLGKRGANTKQIYVGGHSAGGHLAALLATDPSYLKAQKLSVRDIQGVVPISGVFVIPERMKAVFGDPERCKKASPQTYVTAGIPPFLVFYGEAETKGLGKQAEAFGMAVQGIKGDITVKMIKNRDHGTIMRNAARSDDELTQDVLAFIKKHNGSK